MREIRFRGLRTDGKGWVYGSLVVHNQLECSIIDYASYEKESYNWHDVIPESVGQYTGLKDRNGKDIYEGDIVIRTGKDKCVIEWRTDKCKYDFKYKVDLMSPQWMGGLDNHYSKNELEIIGNIHEQQGGNN